MTEGGEELSSGSVGRSSAIVSAGFAGAQVVGIVRELYLAGHVGLSGDLDALLVALGLTTLGAGLITGGAGAALVPVYLEARARLGTDDARRLSGSVIAWLALGGLAISVVAALIAPALIKVGGPGLRPEDYDRAIVYLRLLTPVLFISVISIMMRVVCQAENRFGSIAVATVIGPATTLVTMLVLWEPHRLNGLVLGTVIGGVASLGTYVWATVRIGVLPILRPTTDPRLRPLLRHALPVTLSGGILEFRGLVDRAIATLLGPGSVSALRYAMVLITPLSQIGPSWAAVIYPRLVQLTLGRADGRLAAWAERALRQAIAIFLPIAILTVAVAPLATYVAYGRGAFTSEDLRLTAETVAAYTPILVTLMFLPVLVGSLNARRRGGALLLGGVLNVTLNIVLDVVLAAWIGAPGIALSSSVAEVVVVAVFIRLMSRSEDRFALGPLFRTIAQSALAIAPFAVVIGLLCWAGFGAVNTLIGFLALALFGIVGALGYLAVAWVLGIETAREIVAQVSGRLGRFRSVRQRS